MQISNEKLARMKKFRREMYRDNITPDIEKIAGLFPRGYLSIIASSAGTGKTWLMQYITCQLSIGGNILNGLARSKPLKSVILSGETGNELLNRRLGKTNWPYNPDNISVYSAVDMGIEGINTMINTEEGRENIIAIIANERPDVVFFDTLISFHSLDESRQGDMTGVYMFCLRIAKVFDCAVVCNHHTRKRPADNPNRTQNQDDVIGTSAGVRLANAVYIISAQEDDMTGKSIMTVKNVKNWDRKTPPFKYSFCEKEGYTDFNVSFTVAPDWSMREIIGGYVRDLEPNGYIDPGGLAKIVNMDADTIRYHIERNYATENGVLVKVKFMNRTVYRLRVSGEIDKPLTDILNDPAELCMINATLNRCISDARYRLGEIDHHERDKTPHAGFDAEKYREASKAHTVEEWQQLNKELSARNNALQERLRQKRAREEAQSTHRRPTPIVDDTPDLSEIADITEAQEE